MSSPSARSLPLVVIVGVVAIAGCGEAGGAAQERKAPDFTPTELASLDKIFADVKRASRESFEKGDWSIMASLYPANALSCWNASNEDHRFSFLSMAGISENARYTVGILDNYMHGGVDASNMGGTHFMAIRWETAYLSACEIPVAKRWPEHHVYLKKQGEMFQLVHPCPIQEQIEQKAIVRVWPMVSGAQAAEVAAKMSSDERDRIRKQVQRDAFPLNSIHGIQDRYSLSYEEASLVLDRVCELTSTRNQ